MKSAATPPPAPDPTTVANAQSASNIASAQAQQKLNMVNTYGPQGSVTYSADPNAPGGYSQTTALSQGQQSLYDKGLAAQTGAVGIANDQLGRVSDALGQTLNPGGVQTSIGGGMPIQYGINPNTGITSAYDQGGAITHGFNPGQQVQGHVGAGDFTQAMGTAANAAYGQMASRLDPQWATQQKQLDSQLANQGLAPDSDAAVNATAQFNRNKTDAYQTANNAAIAAAQGIQAQGYGQQLSSGQFANNAAGQEYAQNQGMAQFGNTAQLQQNQENQQAAQFQNAAAGQQFGQNLAANQAYNAAQNQGFNQGASQAQFANQANAQQFSQNAYAQNQPINQFNSLMSSNQVGMPTGIGYTPSQVGQTDVTGAYALSNQAQQANYQSQMQNQNAQLGGLYNLGASAMMAFSDARLKEGVRRVGQLDSGLPIYSYRYKGSPMTQVGVMAQEAASTHPHAVYRHPSGFLMVDYGALD